MDNSSNGKLQIIETAMALMKEKGFDHVSIVDICKAAGITRTTFYYHFQTKEEIVEEYFQSRISSQELLFSSLMRLDNDLDRYLALFDMHLSIFVEEGPEFGRQVLHSILNDNHFMASYFMKDEWCVPVLSSCQKNKLVRTDIKPEELDHLCVALSLGIVYQWCAAGGNFDVLPSVRSALQKMLAV